MCGVLRVLLKGYSEASRTLTFAQAGLRQMQLDLAYLNAVITSEFVEPEDANVVDGLCKGALVAATKRCTDSAAPALFDHAKLEQLVEAHRDMLSSTE